MSSKIPVAVRRNFTTKDTGEAWTLTCDVCKEQWRLQKPQKGRQLHDGNILHLLEHAASHPLPQEEEAEVVAESPPQEPVVKLATVSHIGIQSKARYSSPTSREPNAYKVEVYGNLTKVSRFSDHSYRNYLHVSKEDNRYTVVLFAANTKHAHMVGKRIIEQAIKEK